MSFFQRLPFNSVRKKSQNGSGIDPSLISQQPVVLGSSAPTPSRPKNLAEIEKEIEEQTRNHRIYPYNRGTKKKVSLFSKIIWTAVLLGIPTGMGVVWLANLPYPMIRRPVARNAPILLLPSYIDMDNNYRQALVTVEQAEQLIEKASSPSDLELGEAKVKLAQKHLNALPLWFLNDLSEYNYSYWWYSSRFSIYGFNSARSKVGQLEAKVFQEKNAQVLLTDSEQALNKAKQQYQQASTSSDKKTAIASWKSALDTLEQIPGQTLAGKTAQKKLESYEREFKEEVGLAAGNERISTLIAAAQQFSWQAAKAGQNPPHTVIAWQQIEQMWQQAIYRLEQVPTQDLEGYAQAQKLLANYQANLSEIRVRRQAEQDSVSALEQAKRQIQNLIAITPTNPQFVDKNRTISEIQGIINLLRKVQPGTTAYLEAQQLLLSANNKLDQFQAR
ncbi:MULTISPECIES: hypothetical protein [Nostocales]|uniref:Uncharacterized protein n=2 Tax=Tolypothrix TaxID=111782 RepID=A0A0C1RJZ7_9CYAN|nr:hypothetical protein [Tolypothrix bouteillei]KAF3890337.1 hypothetical protein DA73_0400036490 [Tolypothrix bouteillei VB521301]